MYKVKKSKSSELYYVYSGIKNPDVVFNGSHNQCLCVQWTLNSDMDISFKDVQNWIEVNSETIESLNEADLYDFAMFDLFTITKKKHLQALADKKRNKLAKDFLYLVEDKD